MTEPSTQERIRRSASRLFHELGYTGVTIRGVADDAGVSPALVMKLFGSKAALYAVSTPEVGMPSTENVPVSYTHLDVYKRQGRAGGVAEAVSAGGYRGQRGVVVSRVPWSAGGAADQPGAQGAPTDQEQSGDRAGHQDETERHPLAGDRPQQHADHQGRGPDQHPGGHPGRTGTPTRGQHRPGPHGAGPVSYTHLDVYKRQEQEAARHGVLLSALMRAVEALPSVGRCQILRSGDGAAHGHTWLVARPARLPQVRGSWLILWDELLPPVPEAVRDANAAFVMERLALTCGGTVPPLDATGSARLWW